MAVVTESAMWRTYFVWVVPAPSIVIVARPLHLPAALIGAARQLHATGGHGPQT